MTRRGEMRRDKTDGRTDRQTDRQWKRSVPGQPASQPACLLMGELFYLQHPQSTLSSHELDIDRYYCSCELRPTLAFSLLPPTLSPPSVPTFPYRSYRLHRNSLTLRDTRLLDLASPLSLPLSLCAFFFFFSSLSFFSSLFRFQFFSSPPLTFVSLHGWFVYRACTCTVADLAVDDVISGVCSFDLDKRGSCLLPVSSRLLSPRSTRNCSMLKGRSFCGDSRRFCLFPLFLCYVFLLFSFLSLSTVRVFQLSLLLFRYVPFSFERLIYRFVSCC